MKTLISFLCVLASVLAPVFAFAENEVAHLKVESSVESCDVSTRTSKFGLCQPAAVYSDVRIELAERYADKEHSGFWSSMQVVEGVTFRYDISIFKQKAGTPGKPYLVSVTLLSWVGKNEKDAKETNEFISLNSVSELNELQFEGVEVISHKKILKPTLSISPAVERAAAKK
jgi:hypothetical protein